MPNWAEGVLRIRGTRESIEKFLDNNLNVYIFLPQKGGGVKEFPLPKDELEIEMDVDKVSISETALKPYYSSYYVEGTRRGFILPSESDIIDSEKAGLVVIALNYRQAWTVKAIDLLFICRKWGLDMAIFAAEKGGKFAQNILIEDGTIMKDDTIWYDDFMWECPIPLNGG